MTYKIPVVSTVTHQFPEFVQTDYPKFIRFVELYYEFLKNSEHEGIGESFDSIRDIDSTLTKFVDSLWSEFGISVPRTSVANDKYFLKHIKDFYSTKGSEESFRILFRHLFDTEIDLKYPKDYILRASDGRWVQDVSFVVNVTEGDIFDIVGHQVFINTSKLSIPAIVERVNPLYDSFEVFVSMANYSTVGVGDIITFNNVSATIIESLYNVSIYKSGKGFFVGQLFTVPSPTGNPAKIKVSSVGINGELLNIQILVFGYGFNTKSYNSITSGVGSQIVSIGATYDATTLTYSTPLADNTTGFIESGFITKVGYWDIPSSNNNAYCESIYVGDIVSSFYSDNTIDTGYSLLTDEYTAILQINIGALRKYPGYFSSSSGFLSDAYRIPDNYYYQLYSYVISCSELFSKYKDIVKKLIHPTGLMLFGEQVFQSELELGTNLIDADYYLQRTVSDIISLTDSISFKLDRRLNDTFYMAQYVYWVSDYEDSGYNSTEEPPIITKVGSEYNITLHN